MNTWNICRACEEHIIGDETPVKCNNRVSIERALASKDLFMHGALEEGKFETPATITPLADTL